MADEAGNRISVLDLPFRFSLQPQAPHFPYPSSLQVLRKGPPTDDCSSKCQAMESDEVRKLGDGNCD